MLQQFAKPNLHTQFWAKVVMSSDDDHAEIALLFIIFGYDSSDPFPTLCIPI